MRKVAVAVAVIVMAAICWNAAGIVRCKRKNAEFARRLQLVTNDAKEHLPVGTVKADVEKFFDDRKIARYTASPRVKSDESEVVGSYFDRGVCAPIGCGDQVQVVIRVKISPAGTAAEAPEVTHIHGACL